jgi:hypothetical protein
MKPHDTTLGTRHEMVSTRADALNLNVSLKCAVRHNSSSPPPSPPKQELMKGGMDADDGWVMVEDELLSTAKLFTQHLHHAEYQRLKKIARSQNASTIQNISRPVDNTTVISMESKKKMEAIIQRRQGQNAMTNILGRGSLGGRNDPDPDSEEDDPWMRDPRLAGLMAHRENSAQLATITGVKSKTRASEGYSQTSRLPAQEPQSSVIGRSSLQSERTSKLKTTPEVQEADAEVESKYDEDNLNASSRNATRTTKTFQQRNEIQYKRQSIEPPNLVERPKSKEERDSTHAPYLSSERKLSGRADSLAITEAEASFSDPFDDLPKRRLTTSTFAERMAKRKADAAKKQQQEGRRKSLLIEEIPTFLV